MSAQIKTKIEELLDEFQRLTLQEQNRFLEQARQIVQGDDEETAQARAFLESRGLPVPQSPLAIRQKAAGIKLLEEIKGLPRKPHVDESKLPEHDRELYCKRFGDHE